MFYIVGLTLDPETDQPKRLAICDTKKAASEYIAILPDYEDGRYYIDACTETVVLDQRWDLVNIPCIERKFFGGREMVSFADFADNIIQDEDVAVAIADRLLADPNRSYTYSGNDHEPVEEYEVEDYVELERQVRAYVNAS